MWEVQGSETRKHGFWKTHGSHFGNWLPILWGKPPHGDLTQRTRILLESWLLTVLLGEAPGAWAAVGWMLRWTPQKMVAPLVCAVPAPGSLIAVSHKAPLWIPAPHRVGLSPRKKGLEHRQPDR